ncbi:hypothetical protein MNEG_14054 [Monoraphidium neglectum]|uniref:Endoplasmic reticulum membrane protein n=1 Tax=Monoraphidium neglectum TaxID=145388 RepID=A0A0D2LQ91_9CHLO|nr:hypothetical protein MNEG_14054 [Monoraphidium neglectum]KIY93909.1 hypothetical protein MNEG_14054 [Monoraphidium neglectum]|eukprot:XP_013892929.1 hypothetical protein MNEG_14054 [Monoraphidium neglectum]
MGLNLNLEDQLVFYGAYHSNPINKGIIWSLLVWLAAAGPLAPLPQAPALAAALARLPPWLASGVAINLPFLVFSGYSLFYLALDPLAGLSWAAAVGLPLAVTATAFQSTVANAAWWALGVQVLSWWAQIHPGHAICEGRKPALMDSLVQAFLLAPLFVWFELLFPLGYRPKLRAELERRVDKEIAAWKRSQLRKAS